MLWLFLSVRVLSFVSFPFFFFFNDTATTEIYTLSLHDALPISLVPWLVKVRPPRALPERLAGKQITMRRPSVNCKTPRNPSSLAQAATSRNEYTFVELSHAFRKLSLVADELMEEGLVMPERRFRVLTIASHPVQYAT